jgi:CRISPR-associated exonuclease Cas4
MYAEDDLLPLSALQHLLYCDRQCALIHLERLWAENSLTVQGRHLHEKADSGRANTRGDLRTARGLPLRSFRLGLIGKADVVEFRHAPATSPIASQSASSTCEAASAVESSLPIVPFPIEYKRGRPKSHDADRVQLCAQALCLEEMLAVHVPAGALFYGKTRRRHDVAFDAPLRQLTEETAECLHALIASGRTPPAVYAEKKCGRCSLINLCLPKLGSKRSAVKYLERALQGALYEAVSIENERGGLE